MLSLSVNRWDFPDKLLKIQLVRKKAGFYGQNPFREATINRNSRGATNIAVSYEAWDNTELD